MEIFHGIKEDSKTVCPECGAEGLEKMLSAGGGIIIIGREANQYNDIKNARYWRDKNGVRHKVESGDGHSGSSTIKKQTASPQQIKSQKKKDQAKNKKARIKMQNKFTAARFKRNLNK